MNYKLFIAALLVANICHSQDSTVKKNNGYAMIGLAGTTAINGGFGLAINAGYKGGRFPAIGLGLEVLKISELEKVYLPVYLDIRPFYKQFFGMIQVGYAAYNTTYSGSGSRAPSYSGGFYGAIGVGGLLSKKKVGPYVSIKMLRAPLYLGETDLSEIAGQLRV